MLWRIIYAYLRITMLLDRHQHVYRLVTKWHDKPENGRRYHAALNIKWLLFKRGYHECPSCGWPTEKAQEHLEVRGSFCHKASLPRCEVCREPRDPLDELCPNCFPARKSIVVAMPNEPTEAMGGKTQAKAKTKQTHCTCGKKLAWYRGVLICTKCDDIFL